MKTKDDVMVVPEKELTSEGFERPANTKDDPFWFFKIDCYEESKPKDPKDIN